MKMMLCLLTFCRVLFLKGFPWGVTNKISTCVVYLLCFILVMPFAWNHTNQIQSYVSSHTMLAFSFSLYFTFIMGHFVCIACTAAKCARTWKDKTESDNWRARCIRSAIQKPGFSKPVNVLDAIWCERVYVFLLFACSICAYWGSASVRSNHLVNGGTQ